MPIVPKAQRLWTNAILPALFAAAAFAGVLVASRSAAAPPGVQPSTAVPANYLSPVELRLSPDGSKLYVVCEDDDSVLAVDLRTRRVIGRAKVGHRPQDVAVSRDGERLYVSNSWSDTVSEIDAKTFSVRRTLSVGWGPVGLTTDRAGKVLYVANSIGNDVSLLDLSRGVEIKRLAAWRSPHQVTLSRDGRSVYVSNLLPHVAPPDEPPVSELTVIDTGKQVAAERVLLPGVVELRHIAEAPAGVGGYLLVPFMRPKNLGPLIRVSQGWIVTHGMAIVRPGSNIQMQQGNVAVAQVLLDDIDCYYAGANGVRPVEIIRLEWLEEVQEVAGHCAPFRVQTSFSLRLLVRISRNLANSHRLHR